MDREKTRPISFAEVIFSQSMHFPEAFRLHLIPHLMLPCTCGNRLSFESF